MAQRLDLENLLESWTLALHADGKSPQTIKSYSTSVRLYIATGERTITTTTVRTWAVSFPGATTRSIRVRGLMAFTRFLTAEGDLGVDPLAGYKAPVPQEKIPPKLADSELTALLRACSGPTLLHRRDEAIVRFALETGARAEEILSLTLDTVDVKAGRAIIVRGKGGKGRVVPFGPQTARAIDRYLKLRRRAAPGLSHSTTALWISRTGAPLTYEGMRTTFRRRSAEAGLPDFHLHRLRHTAASRWLAAGGSEGGLMAVAGWSNRKMLDRYVRDTASERAIDEARTLGLGEVG